MPGFPTRLKITVLGSLLSVAAGTLAFAAPTSSVELVMSDGVSLATDIYTSGDELKPVMLIRTRYHRTNLEPTAQSVADQFGVTVFVQDVRGRGDSGGVDSVFRDDAVDGRETLDWIELLGWSNGLVATWGSSALGITQMLMAPEANPIYQCQYVNAATHAFAEQFAYRGGARRREIDAWLTNQDASIMIGQWDAHPSPSDAYWEALTLSPEKAASVRTAGLHVAGWFDIYQQGSIDYFTSLQEGGGEGAAGRQHLLIGPWTHGDQEVAEGFPAGSKADSPLPSLEGAWAEGCLAGNAPVLDDLPATYLYVMGAIGEEESPGSGWNAFTTWPPPSELAGLYLREGGLLSVEPALSVQPAASYSHDPLDPVPTVGGNHLTLASGPLDQVELEAREDVAVFTTEILEAPVEIIGRMRARLWLSSPTSHSQVVVRLTDVYPDGRSLLVSEGVKRFEGTSDFEPVEIDLWSTAMIFNAGHQIRVSVAGASADAYEVVPDAYSAMIGLSSSLPSRLELPLREGLDGALAPIEGASSPTPEPDPDPTTNPEEPPDATTGPDVWTPDAGPPTPIDDVGPNVEVASADGVGDALEDVGASSGGGGGGDGCGGGPGPGPMPLAWTVLALMLWRASRRS